jgi:hypothetical protein
MVSTLQKASVVMNLKPTKPSGLADLGAPVNDAASVRKGRVHEFAQLLDDGEIGRRFQDLRVIGVKTVEGGVLVAKFFVQFEVFGDDTVAPPNGAGFEALLFAGSQQLTSFSSGSLFLPYANFWYSNRFVFEAALHDFDRADNIEFVAKSVDVRVI